MSIMSHKLLHDGSFLQAQAAVAFALAQSPWPVDTYCTGALSAPGKALKVANNNTQHTQLYADAPILSIFMVAARDQRQKVSAERPGTNAANLRANKLVMLKPNSQTLCTTRDWWMVESQQQRCNKHYCRTDESEVPRILIGFGKPCFWPHVFSRWMCKLWHLQTRSKTPMTNRTTWTRSS